MRTIKMNLTTDFNFVARKQPWTGNYWILSNARGVGLRCHRKLLYSGLFGARSDWSLWGPPGL